MLIFNHFDLLTSVRRLLKSSKTLFKIKDSINSEEFNQLLVKFETEVDKLNELLLRDYEQDLEITQIIFELKSAVIALRARNV